MWRILGKFLVPTILLAAPLLASAQTTNGPETAPRNQAARQPGILQGAGGFAVGGQVVVLTEPQRISYETALGKERAQLLELQNKLRVARQDLLLASAEQKFDENSVREKALAFARLEAELTVLRIKAMSQVQPPLTPDQIEKIKTGQPGLARPLGGQTLLERPAQHAAPADTNRDINGLPPKR